MPRNHKLRTILTIAVCGWAMGSAMPLGAAGGGSGGMSSMPSSSAPAYDPDVEYKKGIAALGENRFADAKKAFDHVLSVVPNNAPANYLAGAARVGLKDDKGALRFFKLAIKYDDGLIPAHKGYALSLISTGQKDKAAAELADLKARSDKCAGACPQAADLQDALAAINAAMGGAPQAMLDRHPGLLLSPGQGDAVYLEAVSLINEHRYAQAIVSLQKAEQVFGPHPDVLTYLGFANRKLKNYDLAERYYLEALAVAPHHRGATEYYGELMVERGDLTGARAKLADLDRSCTFGCFEAEELRRWIESGHGSSS
jgi:tetratricopeptide (TPR) repeat protein